MSSFYVSKQVKSIVLVVLCFMFSSNIKAQTGFDKPLNFVSDTTECIDSMPHNVAFDVRQKFIATPATGSGRLQVFQIPLVGDLNGDGKPEIVALGKYDAYSSLNTSHNYIHIFDGQTGASKLSYNLYTNLGSGYGATSNTAGGFVTGATPYHQSPSYLAIADVDNDGIGEIIVCQTIGRGRIYCLKPVLDANKNIVNLIKMWDGLDEKDDICGVKSPLSETTGYTLYGQPLPQIVDINGDGIPEVVVYNKFTMLLQVNY